MHSIPVTGFCNEDFRRSFSHPKRPDSVEDDLPQLLRHALNRRAVRECLKDGDLQMPPNLGVENGVEIVREIIAGKPAYDSRVILRRQEERVVTIQVTVPSDWGPPQ